MALFGSQSGGSSKLSAEERLLEVIQNGGEVTSPDLVLPQESFFKKIFSSRKKNTSALAQKSPRGFSLSHLNALLGALIVVGIIFSVINVFYFKPDIGKMYGRVASAPPHSGQANLNPISMDELLASINRNLFQPKTEEVLPPVEAVAPTPPVSGSVENLELVGIAWSTEPEAMIREKDGRTFFLKAGEELKGVKIKEILKDKIVLEVEGQIRELM